MDKTLMISGAISGDPRYRTKFATCTSILQSLGFSVMNPAVLPKTGFKHWQYMRVTFAMLDVCKILCLLPDWHRSPGAVMELIRAILKRKIIVLYSDLVRDPDCIGGGNIGIFHALRALRRAS